MNDQNPISLVRPEKVRLRDRPLCFHWKRGKKGEKKNEMETEEILQELENVEAEVRLVQGTLIIDFY